MRYIPLALLCLLILWVPLPFGSVTPLGVLIAVAWVAALALAVALRADRLDLRHFRGVLLGLVGLGCLGIVQSSSLAGRWLGFLVAGLEARVPEALGDVARPSLSLAPSLSRQAAIGWWVLALLFLAAAWVGRERLAKPWLLAAVLTAAAFQALYGWRQWRLAPGEILGRQVSGPPRLRGTLVNADHLAVLFEISLAICLAWGWWAWRRSRREPRWSYRMAWLVGPVVTWLGLAAALMGTGSRAALAATTVGLLFQAALLFWPRGRWLAPAVVLATVLLAGVVVAGRGPSPSLGRQFSEPSYGILTNSRFAVWRPAIDLWRASPWVGTGLGTFEEAFPRVQPEALRSERWGRAHNDPLELLVTGGVVGMGLLFVLLASACRRLWRVFRRGQHTADRAAALAALAALPPVALHAGVDFGLTLPVNAILLTTLVAVGAGGLTRDEAEARPLPSR